MTLSDRQKKVFALIPILLLVYIVITLLLYQVIVDPQVDKITGKVVSTVNVSQSAPSVCSFQLYTGENLVSFHCMNGFFPRDYMLSNLSGRYNAVFTYNPENPNDLWESYNPSMPAWVSQDMSYIYDSKGYWMIMNQNYAYYLDGFFNSQSQATLPSGWNLIGYPRENPVTPDIAFASLAGNYDYVLQYKKLNDTWYYYAPGDPSSTLTLIEPDYGYWIHMTSTDTWVYP